MKLTNEPSGSKNIVTNATLSEIRMDLAAAWIPYVRPGGTHQDEVCDPFLDRKVDETLDNRETVVYSRRSQDIDVLGGWGTFFECILICSRVVPVEQGLFVS